MDDSTWDRLNEYSIHRLVKSPDFLLGTVAALVFSYLTFFHYVAFNTAEFVSLGTSLSRSLIAVVLTGIAIMVSLSDDSFLARLIRTDSYKEIMFTFEYTAILSILTAVVGSLIQPSSLNLVAYTSFNWLLFYAVTATLTVVSKVVTFGHKRALSVATEELDDDLGDQVTVLGPNETLPKEEGEEE